MGIVSVVLGNLVSGVVTGSIYALMSMGLAMLFSTWKLFNYAHGSIFMMSAYVCWFFLNWVGMGYWLSIVAIMLCCVVVGWVMEGALRPLSTKGDVEIIVGTLAISVFIDNVVLILAGARIKRLPTLFGGHLSFLESTVSYQYVIVIVVALVSMLAMSHFLKSTRLGMAMRAVGQDRNASYIVGIPIKKVNVAVVSISAMSSGLAGILVASSYLMHPNMGQEPLTKAFIICVLGGLGNIKGTILAAYFVGLVETVVAYSLGLYWSPLVLFLVAMVGLVARPSGLFQTH